VSSINRVLRNLSADTQKGGGPHLSAAGPGHVYGGLFGGQAWHRSANPWYSGAAVMHGAAGVAAAAGGLQAACIATQHRQLAPASAIHPASNTIDRKCTYSLSIRVKECTRQNPLRQNPLYRVKFRITFRPNSSERDLSEYICFKARKIEKHLNASAYRLLKNVKENKNVTLEKSKH